MLRTGDLTQGGITSTLLRFTPLRFLAVSVVLNVALDVYFILSLGWGLKEQLLPLSLHRELPAWVLCCLLIRNGRSFDGTGKIDTLTAPA